LLRADVEVSSMQDSTIRRSGTRSRLGLFLVFLMHQVISTIGVIVVAAFLIFSSIPLIRVWQPAFGVRQVHWILTETPYFPVQTLYALLLGGVIGDWSKSRTMLWVWVLPFLFLCCAMVFRTPVSAVAGFSADQSLMAHFFGYGCAPQNRCFDQIVFTLPFYAASCYSLGALGALLARKTRTR
jgi:hypothetical protein